MAQKCQKILIIEDNHEIRSGLAELLEFEGFEVETANGGQAALNYLQSDAKKPNFIILDVFMPGMNGEEFRKIQREIPTLASIPTIVLTCANTDQLMRDTFSASAYLQKPAEVEQILECIDQCKLI